MAYRLNTIPLRAMIMAYACRVFLTEAAGIIALAASGVAFKHNEHIRAKFACDGPCPPSGTRRDFFRLNAFDRLPDLKPGSNRTKLGNAAIKGRIPAQVVMPGLYPQEELSASSTGMSC